MTELNKIVDQLSKLTVLEAAELANLLEKKWGVTAQTVAINDKPKSVDQNKHEEKKFFSVILKSSGDKKIAVIKVIKEITGSSLKDAKSLVDSAPSSIKDNVSKDEAEKLKTLLINAGADVELK